MVGAEGIDSNNNDASGGALRLPRDGGRANEDVVLVGISSGVSAKGQLDILAGPRRQVGCPWAGLVNGGGPPTLWSAKRSGCDGRGVSIRRDLKGHRCAVASVPRVCKAQPRGFGAKASSSRHVYGPGGGGRSGEQHTRCGDVFKGAFIGRVVDIG